MSVAGVIGGWVTLKTQILLTNKTMQPNTHGTRVVRRPSRQAPAAAADLASAYGVGRLTKKEKGGETKKGLYKTPPVLPPPLTASQKTTTLLSVPYTP